jgi:hypothetical protein
MATVKIVFSAIVEAGEQRITQQGYAQNGLCVLRKVSEFLVRRLGVNVRDQTYHHTDLFLPDGSTPLSSDTYIVHRP